MTYSQKGIAALLFAVLPLAYACQKADITPANRVTLSAYQSARLQNDVTVRVDSLTDSRCPEAANCIWAGNAIVKATLSKDADKVQVRLVLGPDPANGMRPTSDSTGVTLAGSTYKVILRAVTPYPTVTQASPAPQAIIEVSKL